MNLTQIKYRIWLNNYEYLYQIYRVQLKILKKSKDSRIIKTSRFIRDIICDFFNYRIAECFRVFPISTSGVTDKKREQKIIVSLTTYPARINKVWLTVESLLRQTVKPDEVILWLASDQFPDGEGIPDDLKRLTSFGLQIRYCDDLKSHKKYYYSMKKYTKDILILADDDFFYSRNFVRDLVHEHTNHPSNIISMFSAIIFPKLDSDPEDWSRPVTDTKIINSFCAQPFTGAGTLIPPNTIDQQCFNIEKIKSVCPYADDLWLKFFSMVKGTKVNVIRPVSGYPIPVYQNNRSTLWEINGPIGGMNTKQWNTILEKFSCDVKVINTYINKYGGL